MFVDLVGSTVLAARLDAEDMHELLGAYRREVCAGLARHGGHATGFPGDGVVACFGWPEAREDAGERAVRAALDILRAVGTIRTPDGRHLRARIGIATGEVVVERDAAGAEHLVGGALHLASRLQEVADPGTAVIAAPTRALLGGLFVLAPLPGLRLEGFDQPVDAFRVEGERRAPSRFEARHGEPPAPLLGRDAELALLRERWQRAGSGEGQAVLLVGEAGIGKSRLAAALLDEAREAGGIVLRYQTAPHRTESPLWPVREQLAEAAGIEEGAGDAENLRRLDGLLRRAVAGPGPALPLVAELLGIAHDILLPPMGPARRQEMLLEALTAQLLGLARREPVVLLFEDLHWADPSSLELVTRALPRIEEARVLMLLTCRPEDEPELPDLPHLVRLPLARLPRAAAGALARHRAGGAVLDDAVLEAVLARSDGVPLYIEEMTAAVVEKGGAGDLLPATLQDSLAARLDRLGEARRIAQIAAVIGREFEPALLQLVAGEGAELEPALERLLAAGLVFRRGDRLIFKHALVQEAAARSLLRSERAVLHGRIAGVLLARFPARVEDAPEVLAHHLERAGRIPAAIDYYARAADLASRRAANREATRHLERALGLLRGLEPGRARDRREVALLTALGRVTVALEGHAAGRTAEIYRRALAVSRGSGLGGREEFPILLGLTVQASVAGDQHTAIGLARGLHPLADTVNDPVFRVQAHYGLGITRSWRGELAEARAEFDAGRELYAIDQHPRHLAIFSQDPGVVCACRGANVHWLEGRPRTAAVLLASGIELANRLAHAFSLAYVFNWRAVLAVEAGEPEAERALSDDLAWAGEQGFPIYRAIGLVWRGRFELERGTPRAALSTLDEAAEVVAATNSGAMSEYLLGLRGEALRLLGRPAEGLACARGALAAIARSGTAWAEVEVLRILARCELATGDAGAAVATLERALAVADAQSARVPALRVACDLAELVADPEAREAARGRLDACLSAIAEPEGLREVERARGLRAALP